MSSSFIPSVAYGRISFLFKSWLIFFVGIYHILFIHSSADGHLDCFDILVIVNNAIMNMGVQLYFQDPVCNTLGQIPRNGIVILVFEWISHLWFSHHRSSADLYRRSLVPTSWEYFPTNCPKLIAVFFAEPLNWCAEFLNSLSQSRQSVMTPSFIQELSFCSLPCLNPRFCLLFQGRN